MYIIRLGHAKCKREKEGCYVSRPPVLKLLSTDVDIWNRKIFFLISLNLPYFEQFLFKLDDFKDTYIFIWNAIEEQKCPVKSELYVKVVKHNVLEWGCARDTLLWVHVIENSMSNVIMSEGTIVKSFPSSHSWRWLLHMATE